MRRLHSLVRSRCVSVVLAPRFTHGIRGRKNPQITPYRVPFDVFVRDRSYSAECILDMVASILGFKNNWAVSNTTIL